MITGRLFGQRRTATEMARRLTACGHDVRLAGPEAARHGAEAVGLRFRALPDFGLGGPRIARPRRFGEHLPAARRARTARGVAALNIEPVRALLAAARPDLVLIDSELHPHIILARGCGLRIGLTTTLFRGPPGLRFPPLDAGIVPGRGAKGSRAAVALAWAKAWVRSDRWRLRDLVRGGGGAYRSILAALARAEGVDLRRETTTRHWQIPLAWHRLPLLVLLPSELDLPSAPGAGLHHLGPMLPELPATNDRLATASAVTLAEASRARGETVIYIGFGSMAAAPADIVAELWQAARRLPGWCFIQSTGGLSRTVLPPDPPDNVHIVDWVPQRALLRRCDAAVIHAGANSLVECVSEETPMLCIPFSHDQPGNAARAAYHRIGLVAPPTASADALAAGLRRLIAEPAFRSNLAAMARAIARYRDERVAERAVAGLLGEAVG